MRLCASCHPTDLSYHESKSVIANSRYIASVPFATLIQRNASLQPVGLCGGEDCVEQELDYGTLCNFKNHVNKHDCLRLSQRCFQNEWLGSLRTRVYAI